LASRAVQRCCPAADATLDDFTGPLRSRARTREAKVTCFANDQRPTANDFLHLDSPAAASYNSNVRSVSVIRSESTTSAAPARQRTGRENPAAPKTGAADGRVPERDSRYARRFDEILAHATGVFCEKGYEGASMRDLSRATGMSLAGLYYYFESKEKLLYLIQKHTFSTIIERLRERLQPARDPEQRLRIFIQNHLEYFLANQKGMKVLTHEDEALKDKYAQEVRALKREYYRICLEIVEELLKVSGNGRLARNRVDAGDPARVGDARRRSEREPARIDITPRIAVLSFFGMMNWIYTWHNPRIDADAGALAQQMGDIFLDGIRNQQRAPGSAARK
jgi:AcrR family transcriptional regulator